MPTNTNILLSIETFRGYCGDAQEGVGSQRSLSCRNEQIRNEQQTTTIKVYVHNVGVYLSIAVPASAADLVSRNFLIQDLFIVMGLYM